MVENQKTDWKIVGNILNDILKLFGIVFSLIRFFRTKLSLKI